MKKEGQTDHAIQNQGCGMSVLHTGRTVWCSRKIAPSSAWSAGKSFKTIFPPFRLIQSVSLAGWALSPHALPSWSSICGPFCMMGAAFQRNPRLIYFFWTAYPFPEKVRPGGFHMSSCLRIYLSCCWIIPDLQESSDQLPEALLPFWYSLYSNCFQNGEG